MSLTFPKKSIYGECKKKLRFVICKALLVCHSLFFRQGDPQDMRKLREIML